MKKHMGKQTNAGFQNGIGLVVLPFLDKGQLFEFLFCVMALSILDFWGGQCYNEPWIYKFHHIIAIM